jgi:hypothetical protein
MVLPWIATDGISTAGRRFRGIADVTEAGRQPGAAILSTCLYRPLTVILILYGGDGAGEPAVGDVGLPPKLQTAQPTEPLRFGETNPTRPPPGRSAAHPARGGRHAQGRNMRHWQNGETKPPR